MLTIRNLKVTVAKKTVLHGVNLTVRPGEIHAIMGPNGAGKTTLAMSLMGNPGYKLTINNLQFTIDGEDMIKLLPEERAKKGLFVSFQQPIEVTGVSVLSFLRTAYKALYPGEKISLAEFKERVKEALKRVCLSEEFMQRSLNEGFSGGEKKRAEIAQLLVLRPKFAILDEIDSGLDIDSLRIVAKSIKEGAKKYNMGMLLITHYQRILNYIKPNVVHVLINGEIKKTDGMRLVRTIERKGYAAV